MHLVLLSGGSGTRLWPLSNNIRSKQFLKILPHPGGIEESMLQRVYRQVNLTGGWETITIAAAADQKDEIGLQIGSDVHVVVEPERRNTFPAVALACAFLVSEEKVSPDEIVAFLPVDPYVDDEYFQKIQSMENLLLQGKGAIAVLGIRPDFPSCEYGYILPKEAAPISNVNAFVEKPDTAKASVLLEQGALWNSGVFAFPIQYVSDFLRDHYKIVDFTYAAVKEKFTQLHKISFDYEVMEKEKNAMVVRYDGLWKDLGTWESLIEEIDFFSAGPVTMDDTCSNTHIINGLKIPVVAIGQENSLIVLGPDGILVAPKGHSAKVKELTADFNNRPMRESRKWGEYEVIDYKLYQDGSQMLTKRVTIHMNKQISYQYHQYRKEIWTVIAGEGILFSDGVKTLVKSGDVIKIPENQKHGIMALKELELIEVQIGAPLTEEDIIRLEMEW